MLLRIETYKFLRIIALVAILGLSHFVAEARIYSVNPVTTQGQFLTAITWANSGTGLDTIFVSANTNPGQGGRYIFPADTSNIVLRSGVAIIGVGSEPIIFHLSGGYRMFNVSGGAHTTRIENITMTRHTGLNWPTGGGGVILVNSTARLEIENSIIRDGTVGSQGGAIAGNNAHITIRNSLIHNSQAQNGGALHFTNSTVHIYDSRIGNSGHRGWTGQGGAIWATGSNIMMRNTDIDSAQAQHGGGLYLVNSTVHISDSRIHTNVASESGGGFRINGGTMLIDRTNIFNNRVTGGPGGGAGFITGCAEVTVRHSSIANNFAYTRGSAFHVEGGACTELTLYQSTIVGNQSSPNNWAPGDAGGAISVREDATVSIRYSIVSGNNSGNDGVDDNVSGDDENLDIDNSVVDEDLIVGSDPDNCVYPGEWVVDRCIVRDAFNPEDIGDVDPETGVVTTPPVNVPEGSPQPGANPEERASLTLQIYPYPHIICPTDTIRFSLNQNNLQGTTIYLIRVDSIGHTPTDTTGRVVAIKDVSNNIPNIYLPAPESSIPVVFFRAKGEGRNGIIWSSTVHMFILPQAVSRRIDHIRNYVDPITEP